MEHAWVTEQLNLAFGWAWDWEIVEWKTFGPDEVMVLGKLTVTTQAGRTITKMQFGSSDVKKDKAGNILSLADDLKAASSDGLKKTASLFGLALDLYSDDIGRYEEPGPEMAEQGMLDSIVSLYRSMKPDTPRSDAAILRMLFPVACEGDTTLTAENADKVFNQLRRVAMEGANA